MTDEQIKGIARAINHRWWNDDIDLLDFTRAVLAREQAYDTALLRQVENDLHMVRGGYGKVLHENDKQRLDKSIAAIKERLK